MRAGIRVLQHVRAHLLRWDIADTRIVIHANTRPEWVCASLDEDAHVTRLDGQRARILVLVLSRREHSHTLRCRSAVSWRFRRSGCLASIGCHASFVHAGLLNFIIERTLQGAVLLCPHACLSDPRVTQLPQRLVVRCRKDEAVVDDIGTTASVASKLAGIGAQR